MKINVDYIARVEGEASVKVEIKDGRLKDLKLNIWEPPRFFEGFLRERRFDEVPDIVSRICGICPVSHMTTSIRALEKALGFSPSSDTIHIRKIMALSQIVASHLIHLYMLAMPDYYRLYSVADLLPRFREEIKRLIKMKEAVNNVTALFGGRALHPVVMVVGGFTNLPSRNLVGKMIKELEKIKTDAQEMLKIIAELPYPFLTVIQNTLPSVFLQSTQSTKGLSFPAKGLILRRMNITPSLRRQKCLTPMQRGQSSGGGELSCQERWQG